MTLEDLRPPCHFSPWKTQGNPRCMPLRGTDRWPLQAWVWVSFCAAGLHPSSLGLLLTCVYPSPPTSSPTCQSCPYCHSSLILSLSPHLCLFWLCLFHLRAICSLSDNKRPSWEWVHSSIEGSSIPPFQGTLGKEKSVSRPHSFPAGLSRKGFSAVQFTSPMSGTSSLLPLLLYDSSCFSTCLQFPPSNLFHGS